MGITFSKNIKKCKCLKGYRWILNRRFLFKKSIPRIRNAKVNRYSIRSKLARSIETN